MKSIGELKDQSIENEKHIKKLENRNQQWEERLKKRKEWSEKVSKKLDEVENKFNKLGLRCAKLISSFALAWLGLAWHSLVWVGWAWFGMAWHGLGYL